jgi:hypothetical protein
MALSLTASEVYVVIVTDMTCLLHALSHGARFVGSWLHTRYVAAAHDCPQRMSNIALSMTESRVYTVPAIAVTCLLYVLFHSARFVGSWSHTRCCCS